MFKAVKRFTEWLYEKTWPDYMTCSKTAFCSIQDRAYKYDKLTDPSNNWSLKVRERGLEKQMLCAVRLFSSEEYETYKHNPSFMEFVKEDLIRSFLPEISKRVEIRTDYNPCYKTARIEGRLTFWEEIK